MRYDVRSLANAIHELLDTLTKMDLMNDIDREYQNKKVAYVLNLCTVSVSQIIDYDDIAIMEHEYESILNNLNLQNMPKDQALLNILNHLLDTITYFRIQDKEKKLLEKKYQAQIKNAIWEAVPNLSLLINWQNPLNLAATVGLSYMNYRRHISEYKLEKESQDFQLERAAIDQFNNLQRELFDTSWRLADTYNFDDKFRLTERQIKQYNSILIDDDATRRYERLLSIKDNFIAFPPYWYYLGHAALDIINNTEKNYVLSPQKHAELINSAKDSVEKLLNDELYDVLREDPVICACALEYAGILDSKTDKDKILSLIEKAYNMSGNAYDIWQLCAIEYLRVDKLEEACTLLRRLVNEGYNEELNAQLLSSLYVKIYISSKSQAALDDYNLLCSRVHTYDLFQLPFAYCVHDLDKDSKSEHNTQREVEINHRL